VEIAQTAARQQEAAVALEASEAATRAGVASIDGLRGRITELEQSLALTLSQMEDKTAENGLMAEEIDRLRMEASRPALLRRFPGLQRFLLPRK